MGLTHGLKQLRLIGRLKMKSTVIRSYRCSEIGKFWICGLAPSPSRMAIHQWPAEKKSFEKVAPLVAKAAQSIVASGKTDLTKIDLLGVRIIRGCYESGSSNRVEITCGSQRVLL